MSPLHPSIRTIWTIRYAIWSFVAVLAAAFYDLTGVLSGAERILPAGLLTALTIFVGIPGVIFAPRLRYRYWAYELRDEELYLVRGVLTRIRTVVPLRRIQHLDVSQSILEREFDLSRLIVHTAGTRASTVELPGLQADDARRMYNRIKSHLLEEAL